MRPHAPSAGGLQRRLLLAVLAGAALFSALAGSAVYEWAYEREVQSSRATLEGLAAAVERTLAIGAFADDAVLMQEVVDGLARHELAALVRLRSAGNRTVVARHDQAAAANESAELTVHRRLASPFDANETVATLTVAADSARVATNARRQAVVLAAMMAAQAMLVALLLYVAAARLVSRPIVRLAQQLRGMAPGTAQRLDRPRRHRDDEIGVLIDGANALLEANAIALERERRLRAEVQALEAQYRQIFEASSAGIFVLDPDGRLINSNPTVSRVVGMSAAELRSLPRDAFIARVFHEPRRVREMITQAGERAETVSADLELVRSGMQPRWVHCLLSVQHAERVRPHTGAIEGVIYDITDRKSAERATRHLMLHDPLTGLKNRAGTLTGATARIAKANRRGSPLSLFCIDLDGFKAINDEHGHPCGDEVLRTCAQRMKRAFRSATDLVGRLGGDEFMIVVPGLDIADVALARIAHAMVSSLGEPIKLAGGATVRVGACIGIAGLGRHGTDLPALTEAADRAMYAVKAGGKNGFACALVATGADASCAAAAPAAHTRAEPAALPDTVREGDVALPEALH